MIIHNPILAQFFADINACRSNPFENEKVLNKFVCLVNDVANENKTDLKVKVEVDIDYRPDRALVTFFLDITSMFEDVHTLVSVHGITLQQVVEQAVIYLDEAMELHKLTLSSRR